MEKEVSIANDDIIAFFKRGLLFAAIASVVAATTVYFYRRDVPPTFEASAVLHAGDAAIDLRSVGLSFLVAPSLEVGAYTIAARSEPVLSQALNTLGVSPIAPSHLDDLKDRVSVSADTTSRLISIKVRASTPEEATAVADALVTALMNWDSKRPIPNLDRVMAGLQDRIDSLNHQISQGPDQAGALITLKAQQEAQLSTASVLADSPITRLEVVDPPALPRAPVAPSPTFEAALAGLLTFGLAYLILGLVTAVDGRLRQLKQLSAVTGLPVLATYGSLPKPPQRLPPVPTSFLRAALTPVGSSSKTILITGTGSDVVISRIATGLAESFARSNLPTLLVDTSSDNRELLSRYGLARKGRALLETHLWSATDAPPMQSVHLERDAKLHVLPSGSDGDDLGDLISRGFSEALSQWTKEHQVVIITAPRLLSSAIAVTIAPHCDSAVLVVDRRSANRHKLLAALGMLDRRSAVVEGLVVTHVPANQRGPQMFSVSEQAPPKGRVLADPLLRSSARG